MAEKKKVRTFIVIPKDMDEVRDIIKDMRGTQADLVRVAVMASTIGYNAGLADGQEKG